ncbi:hypothetical protein FD755_010650, partial [Muntiacus reevesi]
GEDHTLASGTTVIPESSNTGKMKLVSYLPTVTGRYGHYFSLPFFFLNNIVLSRLALCDPIDCSPPGSSFPSPGDLSNPGIETESLILQQILCHLRHEILNSSVSKELLFTSKEASEATTGPRISTTAVTTSTGVKEPSVCFVTHKLIKPNQTNMIDWRHIMATSEARIKLTGSGRTRLCQTKNTKNPMNRGAWWATVLGVSKVSGKGVGWWWPAAGLGAQSVASSDKMRSPGQGNRKPLQPTSPSRINTPKRSPFHYRGRECKKIKLLTSVGSSKNQESSRKTYVQMIPPIWQKVKKTKELLMKVKEKTCYGPLGEKKSPGDTWTANCYKCTCTDAETVDCKLKECPSPPTCKPEERLVKFKDNDTCCEIGYCEPRTCLFNNNDYEVGASFADPNNPCISYSCHNTGFIAVVQDCPKQTWCAEEDRVYDSTKCCYTCKPNCRSSPVNVTVNYNGCKKKVKMARCTGECKKTIKYDYDLFQLKNSCLCCQEENYEYREIDLDCPDGGTIPYRYRHIITCSCLDICQQSTTSTVS